MTRRIARAVSFIPIKSVIVIIPNIIVHEIHMVKDPIIKILYLVHFSPSNPRTGNKRVNAIIIKYVTDERLVKTVGNWLDNNIVVTNAVSNTPHHNNTKRAPFEWTHDFWRLLVIEEEIKMDLGVRENNGVTSSAILVET